jgi:predicted methyltransferase MtxX (methanogen marker protein 4)
VLLLITSVKFLRNRGIEKNSNFLCGSAKHDLGRDLEITTYLREYKILS